MDVEGKLTFSTRWWECKLAEPCRSQYRYFSKAIICFRYITSIYLPKESKSLYNMGTCTPLFVAILFTISKLYNQSRYLSMDEGIKKKEYIEFRHTMEFCLVIKSEIMFCL